MPEKVKKFIDHITQAHDAGEKPWVVVRYRDEKHDVPRDITGVATSINDDRIRIEWQLSVRDMVSHRTIPRHRIIDGTIEGYYR